MTLLSRILRALALWHEAQAEWWRSIARRIDNAARRRRTRAELRQDIAAKFEDDAG